MLELPRFLHLAARALFVAAALVVASGAARAQTTTDTLAKHAILIEYSTGQVLFQIGRAHV